MCSMNSIPCDLLDVGYRDALGNDRADLENEIRKTNLDVNGNPIGVTDKSTVCNWDVISRRSKSLFPQRRKSSRRPLTETRL